MTDRRLASLLQFLRREAGPPSDFVADSELLSRYVASRDEAAFELLVRRHGPLVFGTARRVLRDEHASEDVFQATFLALARKANSLRHRDAIAGWLHQVALRAALRARPKPLVARPTGYVDASSHHAELIELRAVLDEEVARLPERQRLAVVLCYLAGKTTEEAASQLGCPRGTVLSRLAAARERLQRRLTRRGYGLPAAGIAALWAADTAPAVSSQLIALTLRTAGPAVVRLTEGVLHAMVMTKLKAATAVALMTGAIGMGVGAWADGAGKGDPKAGSTPHAKNADEPAKPDATVQRGKLVAQYRDLLTQMHRVRFDHREQLESLREETRELRQQQAIWAKEAERLFAETVRLRVTSQTKEALIARKIEHERERELVQIDLATATNIWGEVKVQAAKLSNELRTLDRKIRRFEDEAALREKLDELELDEIKRLLK